MESSTSKLLLLLIFACVLFVFVKISNPHQKYGTESYWKTATLDDVREIPEEALQPGNINGPVLMWAASTVQNPEIISALIARGVDVNEREVDFNGTALSAASFQNPHSEIIHELVRHGAEVNIVLGNAEKSPLLLAAESNSLEVTERLLFHGADPDYTDAKGRTALMLAEQFGNHEVADFYKERQK